MSFEEKNVRKKVRVPLIYFFKRSYTGSMKVSEQQEAGQLSSYKDEEQEGKEPFLYYMHQPNHDMG